MRKKFDYQILKRYTYFRSLKVTSLLSVLLLGFLTGNLWGTVLGKIRDLFYWDGFVIFFLVIFLEFVSCAAYGKQTKNADFLNSSSTYANSTSTLAYVERTNTFLNRPLPVSKKKGLHKKFFCNLANFFKIGIMIGFFVDAFKVGS